MRQDDPALEVGDVHLRFGGVPALSGVGFEVSPGEICGLIGPNGAGKTTMLNVVCGVYLPQSGTVRSFGEDLLRRRAHERAALGIARTFQTPVVMPGSSVLDNVLAGAHARISGGFLSALFATPRSRQLEREQRRLARELLERFRLDAVAHRPAGSIPYAMLRRLELVRALMCRPRLLLLDEPASGLARSEVTELSMWLSSLRDEEGLTVVLVEHHMGLVMSLCDRIIVMHLGQTLTEGTPSQVRSDPDVIEAYLGRSA